VSLFKSPLLVLDFETTGFPRDSWSRPVELGAVVFNEQGEEIGEFGSLMKPDILDERADGALRVNNITREELMTARTIAEVAELFHDWYGLLPDPVAPVHRPPYVTSFNVEFDAHFARMMSLNVRGWASCVMVKAMQAMGPAGVLEPANPRHRNYSPDRPWLFPKLSKAATFFGVTVEGQAHRAVTDARTAGRIAVEIARRST
jgi:DNA polymerase III epsilon subunit-like protein